MNSRYEILGNFVEKVFCHKIHEVYPYYIAFQNFMWKLKYNFREATCIIKKCLGDVC